MSDAPRISLVMAAYNRAALLPRAIGSVLAQDFPDWRLVVVDDGSRDETLAVARSFRDPRIEVVAHGANRGVCAAKNTGLDRARGEWVATLDSDDALAPGALRALFGAIDALDARPDHVGCYCVDAATGARCGTGLTASGWTDAAAVARVQRGEHWGVIRRELLGDKRFDPRLHGFEGVLWTPLLRDARWYYLHAGLRIYHTEGADRISRERFGDRRRDERQYRSYRVILDDHPEYLDALRAVDPDGWRATLTRLASQFALEGDDARLARSLALRGGPAPWIRALRAVSPVARAARALSWRLSAGRG